MKIKIILIILVCLFNISIVNCEILDEGSFTEYSFQTYDSYFECTGSGDSNQAIDRLYLHASENYQSGIQYIYVDVVDAYFAGDLKATYDSYFENININDGVTIIAYGKIGYYKKNNGDYRIWMWFDLTTWSYTGSGNKLFIVSGHNSSYYKTYMRIFTGHHTNDIYSVSFCYTDPSTYYLRDNTFHIDVTYNFKNDFYTESIGNLNDIYYDKTITGYATDSKIKITDSNDTILLNETSFNNNDIHVSYYSTYTPFKLECENYEGTNFLKYLYFITPPSEDCSITVNDIEIGNNIEVFYFNIDDLRSNPLKYGSSDYATCDINIQIIVDRGYYEELIYQDLITDENDNIFYYSSDTLNNGIYYAQINKELGSLNDYAVRSTFLISESSNYSIIVNPDNVYVGDNINIIYKSLNQSTISIYDNSSTLIKSYLNIQNEGQKIFQIPSDNNYDYSYPNWYVYLNDSGNSSNNLKYIFNVNWRLYTEPEPTPEPTEPYYNVTIEENIDDLREGIDPIKELIFGISTIFVDNPDYNNDNVVDVNEISTWLNSLISIAIIIFLFILYTVYKRG